MILKNLKYTAAPIVLAMALTGCFSTSSPDPVIVEPSDPVVVGPEPAPELAIIVSGNVFNDATFDVIDTATISFRENGQESQSIATVDGDAITQLETSDGSFSFTLRDGANPESVNLLVTADDYYTKRFTIDFTTDEEEIDVALPLASRVSDDSVDASVEEEVTNATTGEAITASAESDNAGVDATVPQGTQLLTASGDAISGSSVSLRVGAVNPSSPAMGAAISGGLNTGVDGEVAVPVGVADITMRDNTGTSVKRFSNPINIGMRLPVDTQAAGEDRTIETGDTFNLASFDEETGEWAVEDSMAVVGDLNAVGTAYRASFATDHLTLYTLFLRSPFCPTNVIQLNYSGDQPNSSMRVSFVSAAYNQTVSVEPEGGVVTTPPLLRFSPNQTARIVVRDGAGNTWYESDTAYGICDTIPELELVNPVQNIVVQKTVTLTSVCTNDTAVTTNISGAVITYRETGSSKGSSRAVGNGDGTYTLSNLNGDAESYTLRINPRIAPEFGATVSANDSGESVEFNLQCATVTGTGTGGG